MWLYFHLAPPGTAFRVYAADPEMAYFLDSLAPFKGQPYRFVAHPGTPLTAVGSLLLAVLYPFSSSPGGGFVADTVRHPAAFFTLAHAVLTAANAACILALSHLALAVRRRGDALLAVAIPASYFAFLPQAFFWPLYWTHNALAFPAGAAILLALLLALRRGRPLASRTIAMLGLATGVLAACQLYFATWALGLAAAGTAVEQLGPHQRWSLRPSLVALAAAGSGFLLGMLPAAAEWHRFLAFARVLFLHQGIYGAGPPGFSNPALWMAHASELLRSAPWLFGATAAAFLLLLAFLVDARRRGRREAGTRAAAVGVSLQWLATLALFGKHPSAFYLPALAAMLPVLLALAFTLARRRGGAARTASLVLAAVSLLGCVRAAAVCAGDHARRLAFRVAMDAEVRRERASFAGSSVAAGVPLPPVLWAPGLPDAGCYGLWAANQYLDQAFSREISAACPSEGLAWSWSVAVPDGWSSPEGRAALLVALEDTRVRFPAFATLGEPALGAARDPSGRRLAFYRVVVRDGRAYRAEP